MFRFVTLARLRRAGYAPLLAVGMGIMLARMLVMAGLLSLEQFAALSAALVVSSFVSTVACFGLFLDLQRRLPVHLARHHFRAAAAQFSLSIMGAVVVGGIAILIGLSGVSLGGISSQMIVLGGIHGLSQQLFLIATTESRSSNEPVRYSLQHLTRSLATVLLAVPAAIWIGTAVSVLLVEAAVGFAWVALIIGATARRFKISALLAARLGARSLARVNWISMLTLLTFSLVAAFSVQIDRWLSSLVLDPVSFAHYSFAWIVVILGLSVQALVNASVYPQIGRRFALSGPQPAFRLALLASFGMLGLGLVLVVPAVFVANALISIYFPKYADATAIIPILAVASVFRISDFWSSFLLVAGRERLVLVASILSLLGTVAVWSLFIDRAAIAPQNLAYLALMAAVVTYVVSFALSWYAGRATASGMKGTPA